MMTDHRSDFFGAAEASGSSLSHPRIAPSDVILNMNDRSHLQRPKNANHNVGEHLHETRST